MCRRLKEVRGRFLDIDIMKECRDYAIKYFNDNYETLTEDDKNKVYLDVAILRKH